HLLAILAVDFSVQKFVFVSTDKAANPTNVMGANKRIAEKYLQSFNNFLQRQNLTFTRFITTKFGNVLGCHVSVIPGFSGRLDTGGPVSVTPPDIRRHFMRVPEAFHRVIVGLNTGDRGEIFGLDMGNTVTRVDLAKHMIHLAGLTPSF